MRDDTRTFVGLIGIDYVSEEHELWYLMQRSQWGRGFGTQAVAGLLDRLSAEGKDWKIVATAVRENSASWRLLEKNGFARIETIDSGFDRSGIVADLFKYERSLVLPA